MSLRGQTRSWYSQDDFADVAAERLSNAQLAKCSVEKPVLSNSAAIDQDREKVIPSFQKLVARSNVFEGYKAQYELLEAHNVTPSEFEREVALLAPDSNG
jgi:hypothetical protein